MLVRLCAAVASLSVVSAVIATPSLGLRGGGASGIWDAFNRTGLEGPLTRSFLQEVRAQPFGKLLIHTHRCNEREGFHMAVSCDARPSEGEVVAAVGTWTASPDAPAAWQEVSVELASSAEGEWRGKVKLPPGLLTYRYLIRRGSAVEEESVWRKAIIFAKPLRQSVLIVTDLDGTLLGDPKKTSQFFRVWEDEYKANQSALVYNTGRPLDSALGLIQRGELRRPTALICSEGTQIFWIREQAGLTAVPDDEWRHNLNETWCWPRLQEAVNTTLAPHRANVTDYLPLADTEIFQPMIVIAIKSAEAAAEVLADLQALPLDLRATFDVIQSRSAHERFILLVPAGAGKGSAALHVAGRLGCAAEQIMVAGDGDNDLPLFEITNAGAQGVIVSNACARLKAWQLAEAPATVILANASNAGGVLEGMLHHFRHLGYTHRAAAEGWRAALARSLRSLRALFRV